MKYRYKSALSRFAKLGVISVLTLSLSGCVKLTMDFAIDKDDKVSGEVIFAMSDALAAMATESPEPNSSASASTDLFSSNTPNMKQSEYKEGGFTGTKFEFSGTPLSALSTSNKSEGEFAIRRVGDTIVVSGNFDMRSGSGAASGDEPVDEFSQGIMDSMMATADMHVKITFPGEVTSTNGVLSDDKKTVTWKLDISSKNEINAIAEAPLKHPLFGSANSTMVGVILGGVILFLMVAVAIMRRRSKSAGALNHIDLEHSSTTQID